MFTLGIDAFISRQQKTGVEWYTHHLLREMKPLTPPDWRMLLYTLKAGFSEYPNSAEFPNSDQWRQSHLRWWPRRGWGQLRLSWEMMRRPPNVLFMPHSSIPFIHPHCPTAKQYTATTIHDLGFLIHKNLYAPADYRRQMFSLEFARKYAALIFVPSEATKQDLIERARFSAERVQVIPLGVDHSRYGLPRSRLDLEVRPREPYLLYVGRIDAKKNLPTLIRAFANYKLQTTPKESLRLPTGQANYKLILVGSLGYHGDEVEEMARREGIGDWVKLFGWVSEEDLPYLYAGARAFVFPSAYEGFGLPVLQALALGLPTVCSDIPALREVAGDAAFFVPPEDCEAWFHALQQITSDEILRTSLRERGLIQAKKFSWERTAELTWQGIQDLLL